MFLLIISELDFKKKISKWTFSAGFLFDRQQNFRIQTMYIIKGGASLYSHSFMFYQLCQCYYAQQDCQSVLLF